MIDFSTLQGLTIPEGVVTQINAGGVVLWKLPENDLPIVLKAWKQSFTSYSGETSYSSNCILLDIYPKNASSVVNITYGDLTKTLTFSGTNAQQVFFGTFNGVSDSVTTPESGTLTIEGGVSGVGIGSYKNSSKDSSTAYCSCVMDIYDLGSIKKIPNNAFDGCANIGDITIPSSVTHIGNYAFRQSNGNQHITINSIPQFGNDVFKISSDTWTSDNKYRYIYFNIDDINWDKWAICNPPYTHEESVYSTDRYVDFYYTVYINNVPTPDITSVELNECSSISAYAFYGFESLANITIPNTVGSIGTYSFANCTNLISVSLPKTITAIANYLFYYCRNLTNITIPASVTSIGSNAFYYCDKLTNINIPDSVKTIGSYAFEFCKKLNNVTIPASVTSIGSSAFLSCDSMTNITFLATTPPTMGNGTVFNTSVSSTLTITVPVGCGEAYKTAEYWVDYADKIVEAS